MLELDDNGKAAAVVGGKGKADGPAFTFAVALGAGDAAGKEQRERLPLAVWSKSNDAGRLAFVAGSAIEAEVDRASGIFAGGEELGFIWEGRDLDFVAGALVVLDEGDGVVAGVLGLPVGGECGAFEFAGDADGARVGRVGRERIEKCFRRSTHCESRAERAWPRSSLSWRSRDSSPVIPPCRMVRPTVAVPAASELWAAVREICSTSFRASASCAGASAGVIVPRKGQGKMIVLAKRCQRLCESAGPAPTRPWQGPT